MKVMFFGIKNTLKINYYTKVNDNKKICKLVNVLKKTIPIKNQYFMKPALKVLIILIFSISMVNLTSCKCCKKKKSENESGVTKSVVNECVSKCDMLPEAGSCKAYFPRYYFDKKEGKCKEFIWGGCAGVVPFNTLEECEKCDCANLKK